MGMDENEFKRRTKQVGLRTIRLAKALPRDWVTQHIARQMVRAATSVGSNYRAACRAKSTADFIHKLRVVGEECDESLFWMELLIDAKLVNEGLLKDLAGEAEEILKIAVTSIKTTKETLRNGANKA